MMPEDKLGQTYSERSCSKVTTSTMYYDLSVSKKAKNSFQLACNYRFHAFTIHSHCSGSNFLTCPMLFCFFFLVAGCLLQQGRQGTDGEIPEEPRLLAAGQSVVHPPGKPGAPRVFPRDALRATGGPGGRVSPGILAFCQTRESNNRPPAL